MFEHKITKAPYFDGPDAREIGILLLLQLCVALMLLGINNNRKEYLAICINCKFHCLTHCHINSVSRSIRNIMIRSYFGMIITSNRIESGD